MRSLRYCLSLAAGVFLSGCATLVRGTVDEIAIFSYPEGAIVTTDIPATQRNSAGSINGFLGCAATPCTLSLPRDTFFSVVVEKAGFSPIHYRVVSTVTVSNDLLPPGTLLAGLPPGSHVIVGEPKGGQIGLRGASIATGLFTVGASPLVDAATGANRNLAPKVVTVFLAPESSAEEANPQEDLNPDD